MAQEQRTFKWGDQEYLLDDLLKAHALQENNYYDFARNKGKYNNEALKRLKSAITNRINLVKNGVVFDADGTSASDQVDNISIKTKNRIFRKDEYVDQDNTEWAKHYLNKLVATLNPFKKTKDTSKDWDINKHGLTAYLTGQGLNAQDIFEKLDLQDEENPENPRSFEQRHGKLREYLNNYKTWLQGKGFDFTKNDNEWDDDFMSTLDGLINNSDWNDITSLSAALRKLGSDNAYTTAFTSDRWDLSKTNDELKEERKKASEEKKKKEEQDNWNKFATDSYNDFMGLEDNNLGGTSYFTTTGDGLFTMSDSEYEKWLNTHTEDSDAYRKKLQDSYYENPFDLKIAAEYLPLVDRFKGLKEVNIDGKTYKYDPGTIDRSKNRFVAFDPESGEIRHAFLWDIEEEGKALQRKWRIDNGYEDASAKYHMRKNGGLLYMQTGGGFNLAQAVNRDLEERNRKRAEETGNTEEVQKARDRVVSNGKNRLRSEKDSIAQPDAGFTGAEKARLATIAADISSIFLDPVTGTAVGLGSSLVNFGADIADDGFQWSDVKNLGINVGFDLLGAIPLFGDALGTGTKITRQLLKWAPRAMAGLAAFQGVKNFDGMMESWGKLTSGDKDQKMTVQDWRNISQSIGLLTGGVRATRNKVAQSKMKNQARLDGVVGVNVRNKQTGQIEQILLDGDAAKAVSGGKTKAQIEAELSKFEQFKDKFGENGTLEVNVKNNGEFQFNPLHRHVNPDNTKGDLEWQGFRKEGKGDVTDVYDFNRVPNGYGVSRGFKIPGVSDWLNNQHQNLLKRINNGNSVISNGNAFTDMRGKMTNDAIDAEFNKLLADNDVENLVKNMVTESTQKKTSLSNLDQELNTNRNLLNTEINKLNGMSSTSDLLKQKSIAEQALQGMPDKKAIHNSENIVSHNKSVISKNKSKRQRLNQTKSQQINNIETNFNKQVANIEKQIKVVDSQIRKNNKDNPNRDLFWSQRDAQLQQRKQQLERARTNIETKKTNAINRVNSYYSKLFSEISTNINRARAELAAATPIANKKTKYNQEKNNLNAVDNNLNSRYDQQNKVSDLQSLVDSRQNLRDNLNASPTQSRTRLEQILTTLQNSNPTIGGRNINYDINEILKKYNINPSDVLKQGGSINRNKLNKFLNYGKR